MNKTSVIAIASLVAIAAGLVYIVSHQRQRHGDTQKITNTLMASVGEIAAEETAKLLGKTGKLVVVAVENQPTALPTVEQQVQAFQKNIQRRGAFTILATEKVKAALIVSEQAFGIPQEVFRKILTEHADADALVSFIGAPTLSKDDLTGLPKKLPRIVAVCGLGFRGPGLKSALESKIVQVAIVSRITPMTESREAANAREWFDRCFQIITPEFAVSLPE